MTLIEQLEKRKKLLSYLNSPSNEEVYTPVALVEEMLDKLPKEIWTNPDLLWCDPCAKSGVFILEVIIRLMKNLPIEDETLRYNHIINNMVRAYVNVPRNRWIVSKTIYGSNEEVERVGTIDDINKIKIEEMPKFDVVVGNPPYLKGLHLKFLKLAIDISKKYVCFIQPATWLINEKPNQRNGIERELKDDLLKYKTEINLYNGNSLFHNIGLGTYLSISYIDKNHIQNHITVNDYVNNKAYVYDTADNISKYGNETVYLSLKKKILQFNDTLDNHRKEKNIKNYIINISQIRGHVSNSPKNVFDEDFYTFIPKDKKIDSEVTHDIYFSFDTKNEADNFLKYLKTNFARFCLSIYKINAQLIKGELAATPWLDFTQEWTDEKLYEYFKLTKEEIDFIETNIPKYY